MKTALISGSTRGLGYSMAIKFLKEGYYVIFNGTQECELEGMLADKINEISTDYEYYCFDVTDREEVKKAIEEIIKKHGKIDILVNNAGIVRDKSFLKMEDEMWQNVLDVNLNGAYNLCKSVLPFMCSNKFGRIINISSVVALSGNFGQTNYAASKAGLIGFTKSLALEVAKKNITVNAVTPGFINTDMTKRLSKKVIDGLIEKIPVGRIGDPEDVSNLVLFLAKDDSGYITGETVSVNGGYYLK